MSTGNNRGVTRIDRFLRSEFNEKGEGGGGGEEIASQDKTLAKYVGLDSEDELEPDEDLRWLGSDQGDGATR